MGYDVFISHSTKDKEIADAVCAALEASGIRCWMAPRDIKPGASWAASILFGINQSRLMVLVFSSRANASKHVCREVERAVHRDIPVVPLRIEDVMPEGDLEYFLSMSHWMDALTPPLEKHLRVFVQNVQERLEALPAATPAAAPAAAQKSARDEERDRWARFCDALPIPDLSDILLPAWVAARDKFQSAGSGNEDDVSAKLTQLAEHLGAFERDLGVQSAGLGAALDGPAAAKREEVLLQAVDAVRASQSSAEFSDEARSALATQFGEWVRVHHVLESARSAIRQHQFDAASAQLDELKELDADLREQAEELRGEISRARQAHSNLRSAVQSTIHDKHWSKAWKKVDALEKQTGQPETQFRDQIIDGVVSTAQARGDSGAWKAAIDLLTQFGRLGDGDAGAAALQGTLVAGLLKAAEPRADGDAATRGEALKLLSQLDRVSRDNLRAAELRRHIEGMGLFEHAAAQMKEGAFQEAADHYQQASERSCPGAAERLSIARLLAAADAILEDDQAAVEQLESALESLKPSPAFNPDEQVQARGLSERTQSVLAEKKTQRAQSDLRNAIQAAMDGNRWLEAWNRVDALEQQTGGNETPLREQIVNGVVSTAESRGDSGTWNIAIDLLTLFGRLRDGDRSSHLLREKIVAGLLKAARPKADGDAAARQEALDLLSQLDRVSHENDNAAQLRRQIEGKGHYELAAAKLREGAFQEAADHYQRASERSCPGSAERLQIARILAAADGLLNGGQAAAEQLESALRNLGAAQAFNPDEQAQARGLSQKIMPLLARKKAQQAQGDLLKAIQSASENKQWDQAWGTVDALEQQTGRKETQLRDQIVKGVISSAETKGDSGTWTAAIDLLTRFGRLGDGSAALQQTIVAGLLKAAGPKANGDAAMRQEALALLGQVERVSKANAKAAELRRQIEGKDFCDEAAAKIKAGAFQEAADRYQKAGERSCPGAAQRLQAARALADADALLSNDKADLEQLESALKNLGAAAGFNSDEQVQASELAKRTQFVLAGKKAQQAQSDLLKAIRAAIDAKQWAQAWNTVEALDRQTGGKETPWREQIVNGVVSAAETMGDSGAWKVAIDLLTQFGRLGDAERGAAALRERIAAGLLKAAGSKADGDATARQEALNLLSQFDRVSRGDAKPAELRRQIEGRAFYEDAAASLKAGAFQEAADRYQKAAERSCPGSAQRLQAARVLAAADAVLISATAAVEQLETALTSLGATQAFNADEQAQASALSRRIQSALARKKAEQAQGELQNAIQAAVNGKQWAQAWKTLDALEQQTGGKETQWREQIVNSVVGSAEAKQESGTWKAAIDLLTQFGLLGDADKSAAALREKIVAGVLKAAKAKADGDAAARQEALNLLSQLDRVSKGNAKAAELRRQIEGRNYYENAAARIKAGAFREAADHYQKAAERSCPGARERVPAARILASADTVLKNDKALVEQLEAALKGLTSTSAFNPDEQAQARTLGKKIQSVLATKYFELADGQERATPPNFGAAVSHYRKSAGYGSQDAAARQQAAQQLIDVQKLKAPAAIKRIDDIAPSLNEAERSFATSLRSKLAASIEQRQPKAAQPAPAASMPLQEARPQETTATALAPPLEKRRQETAEPALLAVPVETQPQEFGQAAGRRIPGWTKWAATAAGVAACAAGVFVYQHQRLGSTIPRNGDNTLVAGTGVPAASLQPSQPVKVQSGTPQQSGPVNVQATTGPSAAPHDSQKQWSEFVAAIQAPTLSSFLLPAWTAARDRFQAAGAGNEVDVRTRLTQLGNRLDALDQAIVPQSQGLSPELDGLAKAKLQQLLQQAVDAVKASPSGAEFPDDVSMKLQTQFTQWVVAAKALDAAQSAFAQHQNEAALAKLDEVKKPGTDKELLEQAEQLRGQILNAMKMAKDADFEKNVNAALAKGDFGAAVMLVNALGQYDSSYQGLTLLQQSIASAEGNAVKGAEALWQQKKDADALNALASLLALAPPPGAAVQLKQKIVDAQKADLAAARESLRKPDTAGASMKVNDLLSRDPQNAEAQELLDEIAKANEQQGDIDAALASYKELGNVHPLDAAKVKHVAELGDAKKLEDDARTNISGQKWQLAANDLTDLGARPGVASAASRLWPEFENGLLADAAAKSDAASWQTAINLLNAKGRLTDSLKPRVVAGLLGSADRQATHNDVAANALLAQVDQIAPKDPAAAAIRKKIADAATANANQNQIGALVKSALAAEQNGDFATAAAAYDKAAKLAPENAGLAQQLKQEKQNAADAMALETQARTILNEGNPTGALKIVNGADARFRKALTPLNNEINNLVAAAQNHCKDGTDALKRNAFSDAYMDFFLAACGGSPEGMLKLGDMIKNGQGVPKPDETMAKVWWQRAADLNNAEAKDRLNPKSTPVHRFEPGRS